MEKGKNVKELTKTLLCALLVVGSKKQVGAAKLWLGSRYCQ